MHSKSIFSLLFLSLFAFSLSIKINIVDEDYVEVMVGNPPVYKKLLIDPVAPFSYILVDFNSTTKQTFGTHKFINDFGTFEGVWEKDYFYLTSDKVFSFPLKYLKVQKTNTVFKADGVLGLGYSQKIDQECSIYARLESMKNVFQIERVMSYDKQKQLLTIGELPEPDNLNRVEFPAFEGKEDYPATFVNLTQIGVRSFMNRNKTYIDVNGVAKLGLIPAIIAPKDAVKTLESEYYPFITSSDSKTTHVHNKEKFFSDAYFSGKNSDSKVEMIFGKIAYKFESSEQKEDNKFKSSIRIGDAQQNPLDFWYIGIDVLNVHRADFDFTDPEHQTVVLYSPTAYHIEGSKPYILLEYAALSIVFITIFGFFVRCCCQKKKQTEIKKGEELLEL